MKARFDNVARRDKIKQKIQAHAQKTKSEQRTKNSEKNRMSTQMHVRMLERGSCQDNYNVMSSKIQRRNLEVVTGS